MNVRRFVLPESQVRERLDKVLVDLMPDCSRATLQRWIEEGRITVDGACRRARDRVGPRSVVEVVPAAPPPSRAVPNATVPFTVLFEDPHLLIVNKPAGVVVHPAKGHLDGTLVNGLLARYSWEWSESDDESDAEAAVRPGIVHRIDKDTSGVLVVARTEPAREGLKAQLAAHQMGRRYLALSVGVPRATTLRTLYGRHPRARLKWSSFVKEGRPAVTHIRPLEVFAGSAAALVECRLETGRTHQIRVHLAEQSKTPILADSLYGRRQQTPALMQAERLIGRQALHAANLSFSHPITGAPLAFEVAPPDDFAQALAYLRGLTPAD